MIAVAVSARTCIVKILGIGACRAINSTPGSSGTRNFFSSPLVNPRRVGYPPDRNNFFVMLRIANSHLHFSVASTEMLPCGNRKAGEQRPYGFSFLAGRLTR